ncbi:hypothetical protein Dda_5708 [Drechslerella dactyloides]|uniref:Uncharacterized protein n=1 Tax=Drechslerella dactyloides TaxID=74499 RepID=A0AAD6NJ45_DREDA|nr:hypothetical protein Dda_5708 [Drechslerella dactyloides]
MLVVEDLNNDPAATFASTGLALSPLQLCTIVITAVETSTFIPTITLQERQYCNITCLDFCTNLLATWNPFSFSSMDSPSSTNPSSSSSSGSATTAATTVASTTRSTTSSEIPTPSDLFVLVVSNTGAVDINSAGDMILRNPPTRLTPAFTLNSDGTLTSYGSSFNLFADFGDVLSVRDVNTIYGLGFCSSQTKLHKRADVSADTTLLSSRQNTGTSYGRFLLVQRMLKLSTSGSTYSFANCVANIVSIYDTQSNTIPNACARIELAASSVPTASYGQYYSLGLQHKALFTDIPTCISSPATSTGSSSTAGSTDTDSLPTTVPTETDTGAAADFTSPTDPYPVFVLSVYESGAVLLDVNGSLSLVVGNANDTFFNAFQLTPDSGMLLYGANFTIYANTSVNAINDADKRAICYGSPVVLMAADTDNVIPQGSITGPFVTDPDIGLILIGWQFVVCSTSNLLQLIYFGCPIPADCFIVNPGLFALYGLNRDQALYNGAIARQQVAPIPTTQSINTPVTLEVLETDAVEFARNLFIEGGYFDFCSSELGYYTTSTIVESETTLVTTETTESTTTVGIVNFSSTEVASVTTETTALTTTTTTLPFVSFYVVTSRVIVWRTTTSFSTTVTGTRTFTVTYYPATWITTLTTLRFLTTEPLRRRDLTPVERITQEQDLTPTALQDFDPSIIELGCSAFFSVILDNFGVSPTTFTYLTDTTTTLNGTLTLYTSITTSYASTSFNIVGTETTYIYTSTISTTDITTKVNVDYRYTSRRITTTATDNVLYRVELESEYTTTTTAGTTTSTVLEAATTVLCPPTQVSPGGLMVSGVAQPFSNFTQPSGFSQPIFLQGFAYWDQMPSNYPNSPIIANVQASRDQTVFAWLRQDFRMCPGSIYYLRVMYKFLYNKRSPQDVFDTTGDVSANGYALNGFQVLISGLLTGENDFYASAASDNGPAAKLDTSSAGASSFTTKFTARYNIHTISLAFYWRDTNAFPRFADSPYTFNRLYVYNIQVQSTPFTT